MPFSFKWYDDDHTIAWLDSQGHTTWGDYHEVITRFINELHYANHRLDMIIDDRDAGMPPGNPMPHIKTTAQKLVTFPNMGLIVVVTERTSTLLNTLIGAVYRAYGIDTRIIGGFAKSLEEAVQMIEENRDKTTPTPPALS